MNIHQAQAGTMESGDILIQIYPAERPGIEVNLTSSVAARFGTQIRNVICQTVSEMGLTDARIDAVDKGALDCTIRARVTAAVVRATGKDIWKD